jgi:hypothetical protein
MVGDSVRAPLGHDFLFFEQKPLLHTSLEILWCVLGVVWLQLYLAKLKFENHSLFGMCLVLSYFRFATLYFLYVSFVI